MTTTGTDAAAPPPARMPWTDTPAIDCQKISFAYPDASPLFDDLSIAIPNRGVYGMFGASGVGKTTLARLLTGMMRPDTGRIASQGLSLYTHSNERLPGWAPLERYLRRLAPNPVANRDISHWMHRFGLDGCRNRTFGRLSKGQQNRANLLRYLLLDFNTLVMDESLANVDAAVRHRILEDVAKTYPDRAFVYISHHISDVTRFCRRILVLRPGSPSVTAVWVDGTTASNGPNAQNRVLVDILDGI